MPNCWTSSKRSKACRLFVDFVLVQLAQKVTSIKWQSFGHPLDIGNFHELTNSEYCVVHFHELTNSEYCVVHFSSQAPEALQNLAQKKQRLLDVLWHS